MKQKLFLIVSLNLITLLLISACGPRDAALDAPPIEHETTVGAPQAQPAAKTINMRYESPFPSQSSLAAQTCVYPAGWQAYPVRKDETASGVAVRYGLTLDELLSANCLPTTQALIEGQIIYVPQRQQVSGQTYLPLAISAISVEPAIANPGDVVTLSWTGQGNARSARFGIVFDGAFYQHQTGLAATGSVQVRIPDDGREFITYMVRVSDGATEVAAQTSVRVNCQEGWAFLPAPSGCPTAPLTTTFREQQFERGTIVFVPTLGVHYVMVAGQEVIAIRDNYVPGMPPRDGQFTAPTGYTLPLSEIYYIWRQDGIRDALGYALSDAVSYPGLMQRTVHPSGEEIYLTNASGNIYRFGTGLVWGVIIPE